MKRVEIPEEKVAIISHNIQSLKKKMKSNDGRKKYGYHLKMLKWAKKRVFIEAQQSRNSYSIK
jgi:lipoate synthase